MEILPMCHPNATGSQTLGHSEQAEMGSSDLFAVTGHFHGFLLHNIIIIASHIL